MLLAYDSLTGALQIDVAMQYDIQSMIHTRLNISREAFVSIVFKKETDKERERD